LALCARNTPQAWGRLFVQRSNNGSLGNTPTGVGKTADGRSSGPTRRKHPHRRGEDVPCAPCMTSAQETPPQAWGRLVHDHAIKRPSRNTPTGVGKTRTHRDALRYRWKHPHRRGEDRSVYGSSFGRLETPPQAWGRLRIASSALCKRRNTPTGVGKTA